MATKKQESTALVTAELSSKMKEMMAFSIELSKSRIVPATYAGNPAGIFAAVQYGREFGLPPMTSLQNIAVINGKPSFCTDMQMALAMRHPEWGGWEIKESTATKASVVIYRKSEKLKKILSYPTTFTIEDARHAGLIKGNGGWEKWPKRMLLHRAKSFSIRDAFPDVFAGNYSYEELDPEFGARYEDASIHAEDRIIAEVLDDNGVPVEAVAPQEPPKRTPKPSASKVKKASSRR